MPPLKGLLCENLKLNKVEDTVEPLLGDNREVCPEGVADRVVMGYIFPTDLGSHDDEIRSFLMKAMKIIRPEGGGVVHYHEVCPNELLPVKGVGSTKVNRPFDRVGKIASEEFDRKCHLLNFRIIKSYAPGISHSVVDVEIT